MTDKIIEFFDPLRGGVISIGSFLAGIFPNIVNLHNTLDILQLIAFIVSILVGIITLYHTHCKLVDRRKQIRKNKESK